MNDKIRKEEQQMLNEVRKIFEDSETLNKKNLKKVTDKIEIKPTKFYKAHLKRTNEAEKKVKKSEKSTSNKLRK